MHGQQKIKEVVIAGLQRLALNEAGKPTDTRWLNRFARLAGDRRTPPGGLTKGKIERRGFGFTSDGVHVEFLIERHPAGRVTLQRWRFNVLDEAWDEEPLSEKADIEKSALKYDAERRLFVCPRCNEELAVITPGRVRCECGFEVIHDHTDW